MCQNEGQLSYNDLCFNCNERLDGMINNAMEDLGISYSETETLRDEIYTDFEITMARIRDRYGLKHHDKRRKEFIKLEEIRRRRRKRMDSRAIKRKPRLFRNKYL